MLSSAPTRNQSLKLDPAITIEKLPADLTTIGGLIMVGIWITRVSQSDTIKNTEGDTTLLLDNVYRTYQLWNHAIKQYVFNNTIDSQLASLVVSGDGVPVKGGLEYSDFESEKSQALISAIFTAAQKKLEYLAQFPSSNTRLFSITGSGILYKGKPVEVNRDSLHCKAFVALYSLKPEGGQVSYQELATLMNQDGAEMPNDPEKLREKIQNYITSQSNGFFRRAKCQGNQILNVAPDTQRIITANRGRGLTFYNPVVE